MCFSQPHPLSHTHIPRRASVRRTACQTDSTLFTQFICHSNETTVDHHQYHLSSGASVQKKIASKVFAPLYTWSKRPANCCAYVCSCDICIHASRCFYGFKCLDLLGHILSTQPGGSACRVLNETWTGVALYSEADRPQVGRLQTVWRVMELKTFSKVNRELAYFWLQQLIHQIFAREA